MNPSRLLIVDDDPLILNLVAAVLEDARFEIDVAEDGETALAIARERQPDCIVVDVMMPGLDGFEVCRRLRADERTAHARIVVLTAKVTAAAREEALDAGADEFFTKPFSPLELIRAVGSAKNGAA